MKTTELTVELPESDARFLKSYAAEHGTTISELLTRYTRRLQASPRQSDPRNLQITGSIPKEIDAAQVYRDHIEDKHR